MSKDLGARFDFKESYSLETQNANIYRSFQTNPRQWTRANIAMILFTQITWKCVVSRTRMPMATRSFSGVLKKCLQGIRDDLLVERQKRKDGQLQ